MVQIHPIYSKIIIDRDDFLKIINHIGNYGWKPVLLGSRKVLFQIAGIQNPTFKDIGSLYSSDRRTIIPYNTEIFVSNGDVYYIINDRFDHSFSSNGLEIGIITTSEENIKTKILKLKSDFEKSLSAALDGRKVRHFKFDWYKNSENDKIGNLKQKENSGASFTKPLLKDSSIKASLLLAQEKIRRQLIEISQAGFVREQDLNYKRKDFKEEISPLLDKLNEAGLIDIQYLLQCRKTSAPLTKLNSETQIKDLTIGNLICGNCSNKYKDELVVKGFSLSSLGKELLPKNHWMTIWLTNLLIQKGISEDAIIWNMSDSGEEVDCVVQFKNQLIVFELKDRNFNAGDAHPLNYRRVKFGANRTIILTTSQVTKDAKQVFIDLSKESRISPSENFIPIYIEGLEKTSETLDNVFNNLAISSIFKIADRIVKLSNYNILPIFENYFGKIDTTNYEVNFRRYQ